ncbi:helix-turn-helix domain-containing protein [Actinosynnema mirum]|uniref:Helix-turn-helix domain-containing protein n=1 Tax=Actinosynnema mirum (strain ATCC 29888 / DSM 43827 / JCM 3225 / NBRC 14064 / NCIMB 13271 / NRRL B-12336 / IMRU 3971 / 101) TaxID=446462 RepID=C6WB84_ACTMD|nr:helix-turn-helix domain-containing protein [Actinosynnema mirum]ACU39375.1 hypothetical protein Amir_5557 [Actinosynnema mirum DSM 43827]
MNVPPQIRQLVFGSSAIEPIQVAYSAEEAAGALGISLARVQRLAREHPLALPAATTGRRWIIGGGVILDLLGITEAEHGTVRDHRLHIQADAGYSSAEIGVLLGISADAAERLGRSGTLPRDLRRAVPRTSGRQILAFLAGRAAQQRKSA